MGSLVFRSARKVEMAKEKPCKCRICGTIFMRKKGSRCCSGKCRSEEGRRGAMKAIEKKRLRALGLMPEKKSKKKKMDVEVIRRVGSRMPMFDVSTKLGQQSYIRAKAKELTASIKGQLPANYTSDIHHFDSRLARRETKEQRDAFYASFAWRAVRFKALLLHGRQCQCCGAVPPKIKLHVDHVKPRSLFPHLELDINNLQVLCEDCNLGKSNRFDTDFRP